MHEIFMNNNKLYYYFVKIKPICSTELNDIIFDIEELFLYKNGYRQKSSLLQKCMLLSLVLFMTMQINIPLKKFIKIERFRYSISPYKETYLQM